jgi:putative two-component system response regulator
MLAWDVGHLNILVADDEAAYREMLKDMLEDEGYSVSCVENGNQALERMRQCQFDLALLDVMMPGRTGFSVCRVLKSDPKTYLTPVVLVTGLNNIDDRIQGIESGADDFLSKPTNHQELLARTKSLLKLKKFTDELESAATVLETLALSVEAKDAYTEGHCARLSSYSVALAKQIGLPQADQAALRVAGVVHDIGKVAVPDHILLKAGPLSPDERAIMQEHPAAGERICAPLKSFGRVLPIIRYHHEKLDGSGYPDGLRGDSIPLTARVLTVVDVFDALSTERPYKKAMPDSEVFEIMRAEASKGWWDSNLVAEFEELRKARGPAPWPIS